MEQKRDLAIVLRWVPYEERHRVVTALTENHGKISALALWRSRAIASSLRSRAFSAAADRNRRSSSSISLDGVVISNPA